MSTDIFSKSWADWSDSEDEGAGELEVDCEGDVDMKNVEEENNADSCVNSKVSQKDPALKSNSKSDSKSSTKSADKAVKEESKNVISTGNLISECIKEKSTKSEEKLLKKLIKEEQTDCNDDIDDMYLFMNHPSDVESKKPEKDKLKTLVKVKKTIKTETKSVDIEGAEDEWALLAEPAKESSAPKRPTFAQICAKNASPSPAPAISTMVKSEASPSKKQRKRSLFPEDERDSMKEVFGVLDENSVDSPSKDLRKIMNKIRMDSPLKSDTQNIDKPRTCSKVVALKHELMDGPSKPLSPRKRARDPAKTSESPAPKVPHYSEKEERDAKADSPARKHKGYETDQLTLIRRQKQIDYGKNTKGYDNYISMVPKEKRESLHPKTPPKHLMYSRRAWDGLIKVWRQKLHFWDSPADGGSGGIGALPESWETMSEASLSASTTGSDDTSEKSFPCTPSQSSRRRTRHSSRESGKRRDKN